MNNWDKIILFLLSVGLVAFWCGAGYVARHFLA